MFRDIGNDWSECWPTIILQRQLSNYKDLNIAFKKEILDREQSEQSANNSNGEAWQSRKADFFNKNDVCRELLLGEIRSLVTHMASLHGVNATRGQIEVEGWCVVNRKGHYHNPHVHHSSTWSGVYYVSARGEAWSSKKKDGAIEFFDPRLARPRTSDSVFSLIPHTGQLILFPSWLRHWVRPHYGKGTRISVPFNAALFVPGV